MSTPPDLLTPRDPTTTGVFADAAGSPTPVQITTGAGSGVHLGVGGVFGVIYADPPWSYSLDYEGSCRSISNQYQTMTIEDICALPVPAAKDCILYLWATAPLLPEALRVIAAWGFQYKSCAVWDKVALGMGYWFRGQHEMLIVGVRGKVTSPPAGLRISSVIRCRRGQHSRKPDYVRDMIAKWYPNARRLEMFSRLKHDGWEVFGNQVEHDLFSLGGGGGSETSHRHSESGNAAHQRLADADQSPTESTQ